MRRLLLVPALILLACGSPKSKLPDRQPGDRTPLSAQCDSADPTRCGLPWPSNVFTVRDESTETKLRLAVDRTAIPLHEAQINELSTADGFSRLSPVMAGFSGTIAPESIADSMRLLVAQPGSDQGTEIPLKLELVASNSSITGVESLLIGYPLHPLAAASDHVVVVLDTLHTTDGATLSADHLTRVSLGLDQPSNDEEAQRAAYHAPTRQLLKDANIDSAHVLRVWDFTTRSSNDPKWRLNAIREQVEGTVQRRENGVTIDSVVIPTSGAVAAVVEGHVTNLPSFRTADGFLSLDAQGKPVANGVHDAPFRFMIPQGTGNYRIVIFGHGTGGNYHDDLFDDRVAALGLGKLSGLFYGWDDANVVNTFLGLSNGLQRGVEKSSAGLMQAVADISAIERALDGNLGDVLSAPTLNGAANPVAGRRPDVAEPIWTGGSLGGTMGLVYSGMSPRVRYAVLNVPGAGWTHFVPNSDMYELIRPGLQGSYASALDFRFALAMSQLLWDDIDGGNWNDELAADGSVYLLQMSMGDTILPNIGSELCATTVHAAQVGKILEPINGAASAQSVEGASAITQYKVNASSPLERHGFASKSTPAGDAAREQISSFLASVLSGHPKIELPSGCRTNTEPNSCDFSQ